MITGSLVTEKGALDVDKDSILLSDTSISNYNDEENGAYQTCGQEKKEKYSDSCY